MSLLLTSNTTAGAIAAGGPLPLGTAVHGCGRAIRQEGNSIRLNEAGYYMVDIALNADITGADAVTLQMYADGAPVQGAAVTVVPDAAGAAIEAAIPWIYRKECGCRPTILTWELSGAGTMESCIVRVTK